MSYIAKARHAQEGRAPARPQPPKEVLSPQVGCAGRKAPRRRRRRCGQPRAAHSGRCAQGASRVRECNRREGFQRRSPRKGFHGGEVPPREGRAPARPPPKAQMWAASGCPLRTVCARSQPGAGMQPPGGLSAPLAPPRLSWRESTGCGAGARLSRYLALSSKWSERVKSLKRRSCLPCSVTFRHAVAPVPRPDMEPRSRLFSCMSGML